MCLPTRTDSSDPPSRDARSILGMGALMLIACLAGPVIAGAIGGLGLGVLVAAGGGLFAIALCAELSRRRRGT
jgi:hypothetical protein